mmetsp:Transcript_24257/g.41745  ORF Transcript_24257/g.41745 Transcript_24257/m.41745 type:complete len:330 (-) Transcript_24257:858-1847(-)|eukprot:CAMPEP_0196652256 /NCGR_PEP_ID=MMETSP1086-20130531/1488_1 /TAXON_ID=77921 /ORGANISM="Cyanoptyche  gloeocystis , Strain SAG4.97" /LENGTH=329 /DNA_ID=CAMNT_0041982699 /DNA_START=144 /DNA_END=1133 /DNA_ORIENTATION=+
MSGFGFRRSLLENFFKDPFFDGGRLGQDPFLDHFFGERGSFGDCDILRNQPTRRGPVIEEIHEDEQPSASSQPRVQEPDDDGAHYVPYRHERQSNSSDSLFSSSFSLPHNGGTYFYSSSSTTTMGPGGVAETQSTVRDSSGREKITVERRIGDKSRRVVRERDNTGRELVSDTTKNLREEEVRTFDEQWRRAAERSLPGLGGISAAGSSHRDQPLQLEAGPSSQKVSGSVADVDQMRGSRGPIRAQASQHRYVPTAGQQGRQSSPRHLSGHSASGDPATDPARGQKSFPFSTSAVKSNAPRSHSILSHGDSRETSHHSAGATRRRYSKS